MSPTRLPARPGEVIDRDRPLDFTWNGRQVSGFAGDTIVSALAAGGCRVFSRSMKYHRPRGILTADFWDPNTLVQVGDEPNVRGGHRLLEAGMQVTAQNAWPSLRFDAKALTALGGRALSAGFYYKTFMRPRRLWPLYEKVLARFAPGGVIDPDSAPRRHEKRYAHPDVVVAGGGPAGLAAATAAARAGARVLLVEHEHAPGGHLRWGTKRERALGAAVADAARTVGVEILTDATLVGRWEDNSLAFAEELAGHVLQLMPGLERMRLLRQWSGLCDMTPDYSPIIGPTPVDGFYCDVGWGTYGFKAAPVAGEQLAACIAGGHVPDLIEPFTLSRFAEGRLVGEKGAAAVGH